MIAGLHIEPTNLCTLKCAGCARTRFIEQWPQHWHNYNLDIDLVLKFLNIDLTGLPIILCGNYGDPIYHPNFIDFVKQLKQRNAWLHIITNGSYQKATWWQELTKVLDKNDTITFSVDGTPDNFTQYRVNANWVSIETGMRICSAADCKTIWKYIPFAFNQYDINLVRELSQSLGIDQFQVEFSDRFDKKTKHLMPSQELVNTRYKSIIQWRSEVITKIDPECNNNQEHFISADGYYSPCCYLSDYRFYYKTPFGKNRNNYNIQNHTLTQLLVSTQLIDFNNSLEEQPGCRYNCPKIS